MRISGRGVDDWAAGRGSGNRVEGRGEVDARVVGLDVGGVELEEIVVVEVGERVIKLDPEGNEKQVDRQ